MKLKSQYSNASRGISIFIIKIRIGKADCFRKHHNFSLNLIQHMFPDILLALFFLVP